LLDTLNAELKASCGKLGHLPHLLSSEKVVEAAVSSSTGHIPVAEQLENSNSAWKVMGATCGFPFCSVIRVSNHCMKVTISTSMGTWNLQVLLIVIRILSYLIVTK